MRCVVAVLLAAIAFASFLDRCANIALAAILRMRQPRSSIIGARTDACAL